MDSSEAYCLTQLSLLRDNGNSLLDIASKNLAAQAFTCITGSSGSGKSSLVLALAGLHSRYSGDIRCSLIDEAQSGGKQGEVKFRSAKQRLPVSLHDSSRRSLLRYRQRTIGLVFQNASLLPELSALCNAGICASWTARAHRKAIDARARELLSALGITQHHTLAGKLSGGEQQRVAIARSLVHQPPILLADEPTASLDACNASLTLDVMLRETVGKGGTLIVCSHDQHVIERADHLWHLDSGGVTHVR